MIINNANAPIQTTPAVDNISTLCASYICTAHRHKPSYHEITCALPPCIIQYTLPNNNTNANTIRTIRKTNLRISFKSTVTNIYRRPLNLINSLYNNHKILSTKTCEVTFPFHSLRPTVPITVTMDPRAPLIIFSIFNFSR